MKLGNLKAFDSSFTIINGDEDTKILGITDNSQLLNHHFIFIKNKTFFNEWLEKNLNPKSVGIVFEKKYFEQISAEVKTTLLDIAFFIAQVDDVNLAMSYLSKPFYDQKIKNINDIVDGRQMGTASVDSTAWLAQGVFIGENVIIHSDVKLHSGVVVMSGVEIASGSEIFSNTVIYRNVKIGKNVRIHANCTIGADGFGYNFKNGEHLKVWHMGSVIIQDNVEIGANSSVDSGTFSPTIIGAGSKIDNLVQIGHNSKLGKGVIICGQAGLAGSVTLGDFTVLGGRAAVGPGLTVGKAVQIAGNAGVIGNLDDGEIVGGFPARDVKEWMRGVALIRKLSVKDKENK